MTEGTRGLDPELRQITLKFFSASEAAHKRLQFARDEVTRLRHQLAHAEQAEAAAERDYEEQRRYLEDAWGLMRSHLEAGADASTQAPEGQGAHVAESGEVSDGSA